MSIIDILRQKSIKVPWKKYYAHREIKVKVEDISIYEMFRISADKYGYARCVSHYGRNFTYQAFLKRIDVAAAAFSHLGITEGDVVTICMPNTPEGLISFYAANKVGAIAHMIHPLSGETEIKDYLLMTNSKLLVMVDFCYEKVDNIIHSTNVKKVIYTYHKIHSLK